MSAVPTSTLPRCTRTIVLDVLFMRKYALSYTQISVLYYLLMLKNWVKFKENNFYVILSKKIETDLQMHPKTVEASITKLKKLHLIETKRVKVESWNRHRTYRAIAITTLGREYNLSHYKEKDFQQAIELERENEAYRVQNDAVESKNRELESQNRDLELKNKSLNLQSLLAIKPLESEASAPKKREEKKPTTKKGEAKAVVSEKSQDVEKDMDIFRKKIIKKFAQSGKTICNGVANQERWAVDTKFYINSYSRLSIYTPNGAFKQIANPQQVANFWAWLFEHQHRVGRLIESEKVANIGGLLKFIGQSISVNNKTYILQSLKAVLGGVKVYLLYEGKVIELKNSHESTVIDIEKCKKWLEGCVV